MNSENTLCLVVDMQQRIMPAMDSFIACIHASQILLQGLQALNVSLAATEQYPQGLGTTVPELQTLLENAPIFAKTRFSACIPQVKSLLVEKNIKHIILIGAEAHVCMLQTALEMRQLGLAVYVPFECITSRNVLNKENGLAQMRTAGVTVTNVETLLFALLGDAKHPAFKTISKLIQ